MNRCALIALSCIAAATVAGAAVAEGSRPPITSGNAVAADDDSSVHLPYVQRDWREFPVEPERHSWRYLTPTNTATDIAVDPRTGLVWAATDGGLVRWDPDTGRAVRHSAQPVSQVAVDTMGNVYAAGGLAEVIDGGDTYVGRLDPSGAQRRFTSEDGFATGEITDIVAGSRGDVWFGFRTTRSGWQRDGGLTHLSSNGEVTSLGMKQGWPSQNVVGLVDDRKGGVWVTLAGDSFDDPWHVGIVYAYGRSQWTALDELGLPESKVAAVDVDGSVYASTTREGLGLDTPRVYRRDPDAGWSPLALPVGSILSHMVVNEIAAGDDGTKWFVGYGQVLRLRSDGTWSEFPDDDWTVSPNEPMDDEQAALAWNASSVCGGISIGADGKTWFASHGSLGGVTSVDRQERWRAYADPDGWWPHTVDAFALDTSDQAWFIDESGAPVTPQGQLRRARLGQRPVEQSARYEGNGPTHPAPLAVDWKGYIWTSGQGSDTLWRVSPDRSIRMGIRPGNGLLSAGANAIEIGPSGHVWVGSEGASRVENDGTWTTFARADGLSSDYVTAIAFGQDGSTWVGSSEAYRWDSEANKEANYPAGISRISVAGEVTSLLYDPIADSRILALAVTESGDVWVGTTQGVYMRDSAGAWHDVRLPGDPPPEHVTSVEVDAIGRIWVGTRRMTGDPTQGDMSTVVVRETDGSWSIPAGFEVRRSGYVSDILVDETGNVWVSTTDNHGSQLHLVDADGSRSSQFWPPTSTDLGSRIAETGRLAIDREGRVLCRLGDRSTRIGRRELDGSFTTMILDDSFPARDAVDIQTETSGAVWAATLDGLGRWTSEESWRTLHTADGLVAGTVSMVEADINGDIWIGYRPEWDADAEMWLPLGASRIHADGTLAHLGPADGLHAVAVADVDIDNRGRLWLATYRHGDSSNPNWRHGTNVWRRNTDESWTVLGEVGDVPASDVTNIEADADGTVWFGTAENGLVWLTADGDWRADTTRPEILALRRDASGAVWAGTNNGAVRLTADGIAEEWTTDDGLSATRVIDIAFDSLGRPWFATQYGGVSVLVERTH